MPDVFTDPRLPDYYTEHSWTALKNSPEARQHAFKDFLSEKIGVVHGTDISALDFDLLSSLTFPQTWSFKKLQVRELLTDPEGGLSRLVLDEAMGGDHGRFKAFVEQVAALSAIADQLLASLLPVKPSATNILTRFSETRMENLHYDLDTGSDDHEAFRLYINLDTAPRIWSTSYQMTELIRVGGMRLIQNIDPALPSEAILKRLATRAYGGWNQRATERRAPRHLAYFDQGDIFFIDGRSVSHQVMSGHRVFTLYAKLPHSAMGSYGPTFAQKIRQAVADGSKVPLGQETADVSYYEPHEIGGIVHIKDDWAHVFGETRTGRVRRFTDKGLAEA